MKIKKFNESESNLESDLEYIKQCFIDFIDDGAIASITRNRDFIYVRIDNFSKYENIYYDSHQFISKDINIISDYFKNLSEIIDDVKSSISKSSDFFKEKYSNEIEFTPEFNCLLVRFKPKLKY